MFYDTYLALCKRAGEKPYSVPLALGAKTNACVDQWKKGSVPRQPMLEKIAEHFNVSIDYLLTGEEKQPAVADGLSEDEAMLLAAYQQIAPEKRPVYLEILQRGAEHKE